MKGLVAVAGTVALRASAGVGLALGVRDGTMAVAGVVGGALAVVVPVSMAVGVAGVVVGMLVEVVATDVTEDRGVSDGAGVGEVTSVVALDCGVALLAVAV